MTLQWQAKKLARELPPTYDEKSFQGRIALWKEFGMRFMQASLSSVGTLLLVAAAASAQVRGVPIEVAPPAIAQPVLTHPQPVRRSATTAKPSVIYPDGEDNAARERLNQQISTDWEQVELEEALERLGKELGIRFKLDPEGLEEAGMEKDTAVDVKFSDQPAGRALKKVLADLRLTYIISDGEVVITSRESCDFRLESRLYNIRDLLNSSWSKFADAEATRRVGGPGIALPPEDQLSTEQPAEWERTAVEVMELVQSSVEPDSWVENGGTGSIRLYRGMLLIHQTEASHERVAELLEQLRKAEQSQPGDVYVLP